MKQSILFLFCVLPIIAWGAGNDLRWAPFTDRGACLDPNASLVDDTFSPTGAEIDNSVNVDTTAYFELNTSAGNLFSVAPNAGSTVDLYIIYAPDGTNYEVAPDPSDTPDEHGHLFIGSWSMQNEVENQPRVFGPVTIAPFKFTCVVRNNDTGQTMQSTYQVDAYTGTLEIE